MSDKEINVTRGKRRQRTYSKHGFLRTFAKKVLFPLFMAPFESPNSSDHYSQWSLYLSTYIKETLFHSTLRKKERRGFSKNKRTFFLSTLRFCNATNFLVRSLGSGLVCNGTQIPTVSKASYDQQPVRAGSGFWLGPGQDRRALSQSPPSPYCTVLYHCRSPSFCLHFCWAPFEKRAVTTLKQAGGLTPDSNVPKWA